VPGWYTDIQRRAVLDASEIAGLNPLRLINDTTATALGYGITKTDLPEKDARPRYVAFVDIGHSDYSVSIVAYNKGQLVVKSTAFDRHFGGREIDDVLVQHFAEEFKGKYKINVLENKKALFRLASSVEKLKKILSANLQAPLNVESIMNDIDVTSSLDRETFEKLISPLLDRTTAPLEAALADAKLTKDDIDAIELVGGSTRIPSLKARIQDFFGKTLSFTSNQDEAVARGATLTCATLSPVFRVRDFEITDITPYPIDVVWEPIPEAQDDGTSLRVYEKGNAMPSTKVLTFYRKEPFDLEARYADPSSLPGAINPFISRYTVKNVTPTPKGDLAQVRVRVRLNPNGILDFGPATLVEEVEQEPEAAPAEGAAAEAAAPMDTDAKANGDSAAAAVPPPAKKKKTIKKELPGVVHTTALDPKVVANMREQEGQMHATDKLVAETEVCSWDFVTSWLFCSGALTRCFFFYRSARTLWRSTFTTREASLTDLGLHLLRRQRRRSCRPSSALRRTGCTARKARTRRSRTTSPSSTSSRRSATRSSSGRRRQRRGPGPSGLCARPSQPSMTLPLLVARNTRTCLKRNSAR
jgi:heat shock protein 4